MSIDWKNILKKTSMGLLLTGVLAGACVLGSNERRKTRCEGIEITIEDSMSTRFVTEKTVMGYLEKDYEGLIGTQIDSIDLYRIESILTEKSPILNCEAYITGRGRLKISVIQRKPAVMLQTKSDGFYSTSDGFLLPLQPDFTEELLTIEGQIPLTAKDCDNGRPEEPSDREWLERILKLADFINSSRIWKHRIASLECESSGEILIRPGDGSVTFLFGHPKDIETKFDKMQMYYERITADKGDDRYDVVDLRFRDQIVCRNKTTKKNNR